MDIRAIGALKLEESERGGDGNRFFGHMAVCAAQGCQHAQPDVERLHFSSGACASGFDASGSSGSSGN